MLSDDEKKGQVKLPCVCLCLQLLKIGSHHTLLGIVLSPSAVGKAGTEYEWSVRMSPMKMIEVFVEPSIDLWSKRIFCRHWYLYYTH